MFKYETHMHTSESSPCATISGKEQARLYKELGYTGIIITDHFLSGKISMSKEMPWKTRVDTFMKGYESALYEGEKIGLSVFFAWEATINRSDFLVYGLDRQWLYEHPQILTWEVEEYYKEVKAAGGFFVHAHPFRKASYINEIRVYPEYEDGVEIVNISHTNEKFNQKAKEYAIKYDKPAIEGSDAHHKASHRGGMYFDHKLVDIHDFIRCVSKNEGILVSNF